MIIPSTTTWFTLFTVVFLFYFTPFTTLLMWSVFFLSQRRPKFYQCQVNTFVSVIGNWPEAEVAGKWPLISYHYLITTQDVWLGRGYNSLPMEWQIATLTNWADPACFMFFPRSAHIVCSDGLLYTKPSFRFVWFIVILFPFFILLIT